MRHLFQTLRGLRRDHGTVISLELVFVAIVALIGLVVAFSAMRDAAIGEFSDLAGSIQDTNQHFAYNGVSGNSSTTHGSLFTDSLDAGDTPDDDSGTIDNGILFTDPTDEGEHEDCPTFSMMYEAEGGDVTATVGAPYADGWIVWSEGEIFVNVEVPKDGEYTFCSRLWASRGGPDLANAEFLVDDVAIDNFDIAPESHGDADVYCVDVNLTAGSHKFSVRFTNDYYDPPIDRNLFVDWLQVEGPN